MSTTCLGTLLLPTSPPPPTPLLFVNANHDNFQFARAFNLTCLITSVFGLILAAPTYNYGAICGIYFLACLGLGGNIPIDATIALEFIPQKNRNMVTLLSLWQPVGVVFASAVAYGTAAKYRCPTTTPELPGCNTVAKGVTCCTPSSNMGWRYEFIILGGVTLVIFFLRYFVFHFHESPKVWQYHKLHCV